MKNLLKFLVVLLLTFSISSCVKDKFDEPPTGCSDPTNLVANTSIAALKALYTGTGFTQITTDAVIAGVINADDRSGNFYKTIVLQDSTGGISVSIDGYSLYMDYPVGRKVFIKCKDLYLGSYNGLIQLGVGIDNSSSPASLARIPVSMADKFFVKGSCNNTLTPKALTIGSLTGAYQNMLIKIEDVQFEASALGQTYANATLGTTANLNLESCVAGTIILRTSGYADFASDTVPSGSGDVTAIYQVFGATNQLYIRNTSDINFGPNRCGGAPVGGSLISIATLRSYFGGTSVNLSAGTKVRGIVISDRAFNHINAKNMVIQDNSNRGVVIRFTANHTFNNGDSVEVDLSNLALISYNGLLEVHLVPSANCTVLSSGNVVTPATKTVAEINTNLDLESTLVQVSGVTLSGGTAGTYAGTCVVTQGTDVVNLYTMTAASYSGATYPASASSIIAIVGDFNGVQLGIRSTSDVTP